MATHSSILVMTLIALMTGAGSWLYAEDAVSKANAHTQEVGADVAAVFARARAGEPLRYVALGGSITEAGKGWIGPWLRKTFPESRVTVINAGMSATGSALGIFRVDRDVIAYEPDLVVIEYCVNDSGLSDEDAVRYVESLVVRLKKLSKPPAIVIVEAATKSGVNLQRHRRVARHYGLVEVDLQQAVDGELKRSGQKWKSLFSDNVHPVGAGHALYAQEIERVLAPFVDRSVKDAAKDLPQPLSTKPLILDGRLVRLTTITGEDGWSIEDSSSFWWDQFFSGYLTATQPGTVLELPLAGSMFGVCYVMDKSYGTFFANVDGGPPQHMITNSRSGYSFDILAKDLPAREHLVRVALPAENQPGLRWNGPVKLAWLLVAGGDQARREPSPQGGLTGEVMANLRFQPIPAADCAWAGPFSVEAPGAIDGLPGLETVFAPEQADATGIEWKPVPEAVQPVLDIAELTGSLKPAVSYLRATIDSPKPREAVLALAVDYYAKVWLNGKLVCSLDTSHGPHDAAVLIPVQLVSGSNELLVKVASGSKGNRVALSMSRNPKPSVEPTRPR